MFCARQKFTEDYSATLLGTFEGSSEAPQLGCCSCEFSEGTRLSFPAPLSLVFGFTCHTESPPGSAPGQDFRSCRESSQCPVHHTLYARSAMHHLTHSRGECTCFPDTATRVHTPTKWPTARSLLHSRSPAGSQTPVLALPKC